MKTYAQIMAERTGFAASFTGGEEPYIVDNLDDGGQGSLRYGAGLGGRFITVDPAIVGALLLPSPIAVAADTLIALGPAVRVEHTGAPHHGLRLYGPNIGVVYTILDGNHVGEHQDGSDGIRIEAEATDRIYIGRNLIEKWADGAIDTETHDEITTDRVSIIGNRLKDTRLALNLWAHRVSYGLNFMSGCGGRGPKITGGKLHSFNNVTKRWIGANIRQTGGGGQLLSDHDMFVVDTGGTSIGTADGPMRHNSPYCFDGTLTMTGENGTIDTTFAAEARACVDVEQPTTKTAWKALKNLVEAEAGPAGF
jgi:hypothetical protein